MNTGFHPHHRVLLITLACVIAVCALVLKFVQVGFFHQEQHNVRMNPITPKRGNLYDRHGRPLAVSVSYHRVGVVGSLVNDADSLNTTLSNVLSLDPIQTSRTLAAAGKTHVVLSRQSNLNETQMRILLRFPAVTITEYPARVYPRDGIGASLLGFYHEIPYDEEGYSTGLELGLAPLLAGHPGLVKTEYSLDKMGETIVEFPQNGPDVVLTIDSDLQEICERRLSSAVSEYGASGGSVLVLDPSNGDILAAASYPLLETRGQQASDRACWTNRNITEPYEPGSVFAIFTAASLLENGTIDTTTVYDCSDPRFAGFSIGDTAVNHSGRLSFMEAFSLSSNVWFARAVTNLSREKQYRTLCAFGFGRETGLAYPGERGGILIPPQRWSARSQPTIAIGQEITVTPLQLGLAVAAVANGGTLYAPRIYTEVREREGPVHNVEPQPLRHVLPQGLDLLLRRAMRRVVRDGTGIAADRDWIVIGGKTGTAQKSVAGRGYVAGLYTATFVGILPLDEPRLVIVTVLDEPRFNHRYASQSAAPLFGRIVDDIHHNTEWLTGPTNAGGHVFVDHQLEQHTVPNVLFLDSADAVQRLAAAGFAAHVVDQAGLIIMQVPAGGSLYDRGSVVELTVRALDGGATQLCPDLRGLCNRDVRILAARLGVWVEIIGDGYVDAQEPAAGTSLDEGGVQVWMTR